MHAVTNDVLVTECACLTESNLEFNQNLEVCLCVELETDSLRVEQVTVASKRTALRQVNGDLVVGVKNS